MNIEIRNPVVETKTINGKNGTFELYQITAWAHLDPEGYPEKVILQVEQGSTYEKGIYTLSPKSFQIGQFNRLEIGKAVLIKTPK